MKARILLVLLLCLPIEAIPSAAQQPDSKQVALEEYARLKSLTPADFKELLTKAQSGDADARYWVGTVYEEGRLVRKDSDEARRCFQKAAEQADARAQRLYGMTSRATNVSVAERWMRRAASLRKWRWRGAEL
jgi:TPR repeat protein